MEPLREDAVLCALADAVLALLAAEETRSPTNQNDTLGCGNEKYEMRLALYVHATGKELQAARRTVQDRYLELKHTRGVALYYADTKCALKECYQTDYFALNSAGATILEEGEAAANQAYRQALQSIGISPDVMGSPHTVHVLHRPRCKSCSNPLGTGR